MTITTWTGIPFKENQNKLIENLSACLTAKATGLTAWPNTQKVNPAVDITLKLSLSGDAAYTNPPVYMKIESGTAIYYYFVRHCQRLAENTVLVDCHIDSLNTFASIVESGLSKKTMVKRQHESRLASRSTGTYPRSLTLSRRCDDVSEGLNPAKFRTAKETIESDIASLAGVSFYLIYKTRDDITDEVSANPVSCFLCADNALKVGSGSSGSVITYSASNLTVGTYYYIEAIDAPGFSVYASSGATLTPADHPLIIFWKDPSSGKLTGQAWEGSDEYLTQWTWVSLGDVTLRFDVCQKIKKLPYLTNQISQVHGGASVVINSGVTTDSYVQAFSSIDRTDSKIVKIIRIPYAPCAVAFSSGIYSFPAEWSLSGGLLKLSPANLSAEFSNSGMSSISISSFAVSFIFSTKNDALNETKGYLVDSKLWHSDFHSEKFAYDSFALEFPLEKSTAPLGAVPTFSFVFHQTNTINSNLLFKVVVGGMYSFLSQDYGDYLVSSRNNEETIFTNAYLNYLRTGYNYDKKSKALSATARWAGTVASVGGGALATAVGAATGNPIAAATGVTMIAGGIAQLTSAITSQIGDENTLASKLAQLQAQATTVAGADDIDLLSDYGSNKLLHITYDVSSVTRSMLEDLFYYYGYNYNRQAVPSTNTREWFNFIQCSPDYTAASAAILGVFQDELAAKLNDGATIYHAVTWNSVVSWDLDQERENWESWLVD